MCCKIWKKNLYKLNEMIYWQSAAIVCFLDSIFHK
jgi:hypothetical protein